MINEFALSFIQAVTEFLPVSSSGHLALFSSLFYKQDVFFFVVLHLASLLAVVVFTRDELKNLVMFRKESANMWICLIIATLPSALFGFFFEDYIKMTFLSPVFLPLSFAFTGSVLLMTKNTCGSRDLDFAGAFLIGLFQVLSLFPGISRSGMTISAAMFIGIKKKKAVQFSFLLLIPLIIGAAILELKEAYFSFTLALSFLLTFVLSLLFLNFLERVVLKNKFWIFGIYCFFVSALSLFLWFFH